MTNDQGSYTELSEDWTDDPWFRFPRAFIRDERLSWECRAVAAWMASHDPSFRFTVDYIVRSGPAGRDKIRRIMKELETAGYLVRVRERNADGSFGAIVHRLHPRPVTQGAEQKPRSTPAPENPGLDGTPETRRSAPAPEKPSPGEPSPVDQEVHKEIKRRMEGEKEPTATSNTPSAEALELIASLSFGSHLRPTRREADTLARLVDAALAGGLSAPEVRRHAQAKVNQAKTNPVNYLRRGLAAENLPIPVSGCSAPAPDRTQPVATPSDARRAEIRKQFGGRRGIHYEQRRREVGA